MANVINIDDIGSDPVTAPSMRQPLPQSRAPVSTGPMRINIDDIDAGVSSAMSRYAKPLPEREVGIMESLYRGGVEGATFGFDDELGLSNAKDRELSRQQNPWTHFAGEIAGGIIPTVALGGAGALIKGGGVAAQAGRAALTPFTANPVSTLGQGVREGIKLGASYGALSGAGHAESAPGADTMTELKDRALGAAHGGAIGAVLGGPLGAVGYKVGEGLGIARAARNEFAGTDTGALAAVDRSLARDAIEPATLRAQIEVPKYGRLTTDEITNVARLANEGHSVQDIAQQVGMGDAAVRKALDAFSTRNASPVSIVERANMTGVAGGDNTNWTLRAGMATPGQGRAVAAETLTERQMGQAGRINDAADNIVRAGDPHARAAAMKEAERQAYDAAYAVKQPFDLAPVLDPVDARFAGRQTEIATKLRTATELFSEKAPGRPATFNPFKDVEHFQEAKIDLDHMIETSMNLGKPTPLTRQLTILKKDLMDEVSRTNPTWRVANDTFAENAAARRLYGDAQSASFRITTDTRKELQTLSNLQQTAKSRTVTPEARKAAQVQIDMYRDGLAESITNHVMNKGDTGDHVAKFLTPAGRYIITSVLGKKDAAALLKVLHEEQSITRTYRGLGGSQTTPLREAINELNGPAMMASAWDYASPRKLFDLLVAKGGAKYVERRNEKMVPMLTETNPIRQLDTLRNIEQMRNVRQVSGTRGTLAAPVVGNAMIDPLRSNPKPRGLLSAPPR